MAAMDYPPTRIGAGRNAIEKYKELRQQVSPNDCLGLITFESRPRVVCPLAWLSDPSQAVFFSRSLTTIQPHGGTRLDRAFDLATECLLIQICGLCLAQEGRVRVHVLTDGHSGGNPEKAAHELKENGVVIDITGIGGAPEEVNESLLKRCASIEDGRLLYRFIGDGDSNALAKHFGRLAIR
ncbi:MAG: VWA domain-containing protein [Candidatus Omnitrophica bacterium]|nr:VWA domain-containing protein [Candidatus Omnitrophota bacterium]